MELTLIYAELKELGKKLDHHHKEITNLMVDVAVHNEKFKSDRRFQSAIWGVIGGGAAAIIDLLFRK